MTGSDSYCAVRDRNYIFHGSLCTYRYIATFENTFSSKYSHGALLIFAKNIFFMILLPTLTFRFFVYNTVLTMLQIHTYVFDIVKIPMYLRL